MSDQVCYDAPKSPRWEAHSGPCVNISQPLSSDVATFEFARPSEEQYQVMRKWLIAALGDDYTESTIIVMMKCHTTFLLHDRGWNMMHEPSDYSQETTLRVSIPAFVTPVFKLAFC